MRSASLVGVCALLCSALSGAASAQTSTDVGTVGIAGSASQSDGTWTVSGSGADIWGTSDSFQFVHVTGASNWAIEARVMDLQDTNTFAKAGVMLRASTAADAAAIILDVRPNGLIEYMKRAAGGRSMEVIKGSNTPVAFPVWLRLNSMSGSVSAWTSQDGLHWARVETDGEDPVIGPTPEAGLAVTSHDQTQLNTAHFTNVNFHAVPSADGWTVQNVGAVGLNGTVTDVDGLWTMSGAGSDIWGTADSFNFLYRGSFIGTKKMRVRIDDMDSTNAFAKAGLMVRSGLQPDAAAIIFDVTPSGGVELMNRLNSGEEMVFRAGTIVTFPVWLQLEDITPLFPGSTFRPNFAASVSQDGVNWRTFTDITPAVEIAPMYFGGLAVTSHDTTRLNTVHAHGLSFDLTPVDIGNTGLVGNAGANSTKSNAPIIVEAAGADVWGAADSFTFVPTAGTNTVAARVTALVAGTGQPVNPFAKAGVMVRDGTAANAVNVILDAKPNGEVEFMARRCAGCNTEFLGGAPNAPLAFPLYLTLTVSGSTYTASVSSDNVHQTVIGSVDLPMSTPQSGLAVTSHDTSMTVLAEFDSPPQ